MKYLKYLNQFAIKDSVNLTLIIIFSLEYLISFAIWHFYLRYREVYIFSNNGIYPIRFLTIILLINLILGIFSYNREKELAYLLLGVNIFLASLILILEIFYFINLSYV